MAGKKIQIGVEKKMDAGMTETNRRVDGETVQNGLVYRSCGNLVLTNWTGLRLCPIHSYKPPHAPTCWSLEEERNCSESTTDTKSSGIDLDTSFPQYLTEEGIYNFICSWNRHAKGPSVLTKDEWAKTGSEVAIRISSPLPRQQREPTWIQILEMLLRDEMTPF